jgi:hypothetical protein
MAIAVDNRFLYKGIWAFQDGGVSNIGIRGKEKPAAKKKDKKKDKKKEIIIITKI